MNDESTALAQASEGKMGPGRDCNPGSDATKARATGSESEGKMGPGRDCNRITMAA